MVGPKYQQFYSREKGSLRAKNKGWEDPGTGLDTLEKRKILLSVQVM
jgi:hypothetical protein